KPEEGVLQFLDIRVHVRDGLCWEYGKITQKPVFSKHSCHSKIDKAGVVKSLVKNALDRSCTHYMNQAVQRQWRRLEDAGYQEGHS
ncbi:unnamed protein product, partial [Ixodes persulcatus]